MASLRVVLLCIAAAVTYGIVHDQITARVCVEYFTIAHPPIFRTTDPTLLGLGWGVIATWWAGALLGVPLAIAARGGSRPPRDAAALTRPIARLLCLMASAASFAGIAGWYLARSGVLQLNGPLADQLPVAHHAAFLAVRNAHLASYYAGFGGGSLVIVQTWRVRGAK